MKAMDYEYFIRRAYNCGRHGTHGANADIYRRYERDIRLLENNQLADQKGEPRPWGATDEALSAKINQAAGEVYANLKNAVHHVMSMQDDELTDEYRDLEKLLSDLKPERNAIDDVIERGTEIFRNIGLELT